LTEEGLVCPVCGGRSVVVTGSGEVVCGSCGYVFEYAVDTGPEWLPRDAEERMRVGLPLSSYPDGRISTVVEGDLKRVQVMVNRRFLDTREPEVLHRVESILFMLEAPTSLRDEVYACIERARDSGLIKGRSRDVFIVACSYLVLKERGSPIYLKRVAQKLGIHPKDLSRAVSLLVSHGVVASRVVLPHDYIPSVVSKLRLPKQVADRAVELADSAVRERLTIGKNPASFAAACVYLAAKELGLQVTEKDAASTVGVTELTLRKRVKELVKVSRGRVRSAKRA